MDDKVDRKEFEIVRTASRLFEQACNGWMKRALKAEAELDALKNPKPTETK